MHHSGKKLLIAVLAIQLFALPIILINARTQQETRSRASEHSQEVIDEETHLSEDHLNYQDGFLAENLPAEEATRSQAFSSNLSAQETRRQAIKREVYAFIPYWQINDQADKHLQYNYMTTLSYFGISLAPNGEIRKTNTAWKRWVSPEMRQIMTNARAAGVKLHPSIVLFNGNGQNRIGEMLNNPENRNRAVQNIMQELKNSPVPVDGVNIDFEVVGKSDREEFVIFIRDLKEAMNAHDPKWTIVVDTLGSSAGGTTGFDFASLNPYVDAYFVMSYHLRVVQRSDRAGSKQPYDRLDQIAKEYLRKAPGEKIIIGYPHYTSEWITEDSSFRSKTLGGDGTVFLPEAVSKMRAYGRHYDDNEKSAWYTYYECSGNKPGWRQVYFNDEQAMTDKFNISNIRNLRGVGFWAQNYDKGVLDVWKAVYNSFGDKTKISSPTFKPGTSPVSETRPDPNCKPPSDSPTVSLVPSGNTTLNMSVGLHGIGTTGDNQFPTANSGNKNPLKRKVNLKLEVFAPNQARIGEITKELSYNNTSGKYEGTISTNLSPNIYNLYVSSNGYLQKRVDYSIRQGVNNIPSFNLSTGDVNFDKARNLIDWNILRACSEFDRTRNRTICPDNSILKSASDLDSNGKVDQDDITLWIHEFSSPGGGPPSPTPTRQASPTPTPSTTKPNIVVLMLDDHPYMDNRIFERLPNIKSLFLNQGMTFSNYWANFSLCCPGRANFLTGQEAHHHGVTRNLATLLDPRETIATELQSVGYHTQISGKYFNNSGSLRDKTPPGWNDVAIKDSGPYYDYPAWVNGQKEAHTNKPSDYSTDVMRAHSLRFFKNTPSSKPVFALLTPNATHGGWDEDGDKAGIQPVPAPRHEGDSRCANIPPWKPANYNEADISDKPSYIKNKPLLKNAQGWPLQRACESMLSVDEWVGKVVDELKSQGRYENTIFILTADNGMAWGSNRIEAKTAPHTAQMPLFISWPAEINGRSEKSHLVSNIDLAPTLCEIAGCEMGPFPNGLGVDGQSFASLLSTRYRGLPSRDAIILEGKGSVPEFRGLMTASNHSLGQWLYVRYTESGETELYDMSGGPCIRWQTGDRGDPCMMRNQAGNNQYNSVKNRLQDQLNSMW